MIQNNLLSIKILWMMFVGISMIKMISNLQWCEYSRFKDDNDNHMRDKRVSSFMKNLTD